MTAEAILEVVALAGLGLGGLLASTLSLLALALAAEWLLARRAHRKYWRHR